MYSKLQKQTMNKSTKNRHATVQAKVDTGRKYNRPATTPTCNVKNKEKEEFILNTKPLTDGTEQELFLDESITRRYEEMQDLRASIDRFQPFGNKLSSRVPDKQNAESTLAKYIARFRQDEPRSRNERELIQATAKKQDFWWLNGSSPSDCSTPRTTPESARSRSFFQENAGKKYRAPTKADLEARDAILANELAARAEELLEQSASTVASTIPAVSTVGLGSESSAGSEEPKKPVANMRREKVPEKSQTDILYQWRLRRKMEQARGLADAPAAKAEKETEDRLSAFRRRLLVRHNAESSKACDVINADGDVEAFRRKAVTEPVNKNAEVQTVEAASSLPEIPPPLRPLESKSPPSVDFPRPGGPIPPHLHRSSDIIDDSDVTSSCRSSGENDVTRLEDSCDVIRRKQKQEQRRLRRVEKSLINQIAELRSKQRALLGDDANKDLLDNGKDTVDVLNAKNKQRVKQLPKEIEDDSERHGDVTSTALQSAREPPDVRDVDNLRHSVEAASECDVNGAIYEHHKKPSIQQREAFMQKPNRYAKSDTAEKPFAVSHKPNNRSSHRKEVKKTTVNRNSSEPTLISVNQSDERNPLERITTETAEAAAAVSSTVRNVANDMDRNRSVTRPSAPKVENSVNSVGVRVRSPIRDTARSPTQRSVSRTIGQVVTEHLFDGSSLSAPRSSADDSLAWSSCEAHKSTACSDSIETPRCRDSPEAPVVEQQVTAALNLPRRIPSPIESSSLGQRHSEAISTPDNQPYTDSALCDVIEDLIIVEVSGTAREVANEEYVTLPSSDEEEFENDDILRDLRQKRDEYLEELRHIDELLLDKAK